MGSVVTTTSGARNTSSSEAPTVANYDMVIFPSAALFDDVQYACIRRKLRLHKGAKAPNALPDGDKYHRQSTPQMQAEQAVLKQLYTPLWSDMEAFYRGQDVRRGTCNSR